MAVIKSIYLSCKSYFTQRKKIAELGAQYVMGEEWGEYGPPYFKDVFSNLDITTFDATGENESITTNLSDPIKEQYKNIYDLVTNFGTTEHVKNQYTCWKNIFQMLKTGGIVISEIPKKGNWAGHCKYYFDYSTFLSLDQDFEIIEIRDNYYQGQGYLIFCIMRKKHSGDFLSDKEKFLSNIEVVEEYIDNQGY